MRLKLIGQTQDEELRRRQFSCDSHYRHHPSTKALAPAGQDEVIMIFEESGKDCPPVRRLSTLWRIITYYHAPKFPPWPPGRPGINAAYALCIRVHRR